MSMRPRRLLLLLTSALAMSWVAAAHAAPGWDGGLDSISEHDGAMRDASVGDSEQPAAAPAPAPASAPAPAAAPPAVAPDPETDRRRPGQFPVPEPIPEQVNPGAVQPPPPEAFPTDTIPIPDRWRLIETLGIVKEKWWDPYNQNTLKGDRPLKGTEDWFLVLTGISDTIVEPRSFPIPVGVQTTTRPGSLDVFGNADSLVFAQTFIASAALIKGATAFKPPDWEFRVTAAINYNYVRVDEKRVLFVQPTEGTDRNDWFIGLQEAFVDYHIRNVSERYDFDSIRVGIQPFNADFRGFLFQDNQLGVRLFGNRDGNRWQYNLAAFLRLEKETNSGLNDVTQTPREDYVFIANLYRQDFPHVGLTSQATVVYNMNREGDDIQIDTNGFPVRPALLGTLRGRSYDVVYLGYSVDGRIGRLNLSATAYAALGSNRNNLFTDRESRIQSFFIAAEPSMDFNWIRVRLSGLFASGDGNPYDKIDRGFDAIFENPQFAGADTSYWIRQTIPFAGGGRAVSVNGRNGILNSLRSSKEEGQSNFTNPGTILLGAGADFDLMPQLRTSLEVNHLWFHKTATIEALRQQATVGNAIGWDVSAAVTYRPNFIQNIVFRLSGAVLDPSKGFRSLFSSRGRDDRYYSVLFNAALTY
jgi:hypothetical protein